MKLSFKTGYILYDLLLLMPFVDMITGYAFNLNMNGIITYIGQGYRIFIFLYMVCTLYCHKFSKKQLWLIIFTIFLFLLNLIQYIRFNGSVIENFSYTLKLLLPVYLIYSLSITSRYDKDIINRLLNVYSWIYPLSLVIPKILGIGFYISNYAFESGYKGFYYANNELNVILMVLFVYNFQKLYDNIIVREKNSKDIHGINGIDFTNLLKLFLIIFALLFIGSKTSILSLFIVCLAYLFKYEGLKYKLKFILLLICLGLPGIPFIGFILNSQINNIISRIIYSYNRYVEIEGFLSFLLSRRNLRIKPGFDFWYSDGYKGVLNFILGIGKSTKCPNDGISANQFALIELDFFDCLFWFGIVTVCIIIVFYLSFFIKSLKVRDLFMEKVMFLFVFSFSMIAGHVMMSANSGTIFAIITADLFIKSCNKRAENIKENAESN